MDTVLAIFTQLGADSSILYQFVVVVVLFVLMKFIFVNKLQTVIETREEKTVKLEVSADSTFEKIEELENTYKAEINKAYSEAQAYINNKKADITNEHSSFLKKTEKEVQDYVDEARKKNEEEIGGQKGSIISEADSLAENLISKLTH